MKIFYSHDIFSEQEYGGVSRYFAEIIKRFSYFDLDINIIAGLYFNKYLKQQESIGKINGLMIEKKINKLFLRCTNEIYQNILLRSEKDVVFHQTYYSPFPVKQDLKVVTTVHDMVHELFPNLFHKTNLTTYAKRKSCERANRIIVVSESTKRDLINLFQVNPDKIEVIYHGTSFLEEYEDVNSSHYPYPYVLFVGSRKLYKNFDMILKIFNQSSDLSKNFHLISFGGGQFTKEEKIRISSYKLDNIVHHRSGPDALLAQYYSGARALIYPSRYEGFGIPLLEAMSMKCPVICSNQSSLPEVALDAAIYFNPNDIEEIKYTLEKVLFDDNALSQISIKGFERQKFFTWEKTAQKTLDTYKKLLKS